jgi:Kef-type K+ transport system membrane component KefB
MSTFLQLAILLAIILLTAKMAGYLAIQLGQPSVLGELVVGILLGPSLLNLLHLPVFDEELMTEILKLIGEIGVLLLMFLAGLELHMNEFRSTGKVSIFSGSMGVLLPVLLGFATGMLAGLTTDHSIFLGLTLGATSVSISARTLMELKQLRSRVGLGVLGAAVFDDILVILLLSIFFALSSGTGGLGSVLLVFGQMILFFALALLFGLWLLPLLVRRVRELPVSQNVLSLSIIVLLIFSIAAELIGGMAAITGAFLAGLMFARSSERENLEPRISALAYGFFVPIFFVDIGLSVDIKAIFPTLGFTLLVILVAVASKLLGAGLGARLAGFSWRESAQLGAAMVSRGEVGLIIAAVGLSAGLVSDSVFASIVGMVIVTTLITPPMLRSLFDTQKETP